MTFLLFLFIGLNGFIAAVWVMRLVALFVASRILRPLSSDRALPREGDLPSVSFIVAGKDEAANIETCLQSLCDLQYPRLQIIAVNDRSGDTTGEIMDRIAAGRERLEVHHVRHLRDGWFGKNNAMREGVERATGEWLCFTDADCIQTSPRSLAIAMQYALENKADFLSVLPSHEAHSFWERAVQPACSAVMILWFNPLVVNNPKRKTAYANGAFMLMTRACYEAIGGHEAVKDQINEDMHMARLAKRAGRRLVVVGNRDLYTVRMYGTLKQIWSGWTRIFCGSFTSVGHLVAAAIVLGTFTFMPWISLAAAILMDGLTAERGDLELLKTLALSGCGLQLLTMAVFYAMSRVGFFYGLIYPIGAILSMGTLLNAIRCASGLGAIRWRGTTYRDGEIAPEASAA